MDDLSLNNKIETIYDINKIVISNEEKNELINTIRYKHKIEKRIEKQVNEKNINDQRHLIWLDAIVKATENQGHLIINSSPVTIPVIDPIIYNFEKDTKDLQLIALRLVGVGLEYIPDELCIKLHTLQILSLCNNKLTSIPDTIIHLTNLQELNLLKNNIIELPQKFGLLCSLNNLLISNNLLYRLPITFGGLNQIQRLDLEYNKIYILTENLNNMINCHTININYNQLKHLPKCLGSMPSLTMLSCTGNQLSHLPNELFLNRKIKILRLSNNNIRNIPESIGNLSKLVELSLDHNDLKLLPLTFYKLKHLKILRIEGNKDLDDPSPKIIEKGCKEIIQYYYNKYHSNELHKMKTIILDLLNILKQIVDRNLADPSLFQSNIKINNKVSNGDNEVISEDVDDWYATQWNYLFHDLIPKLKDIWLYETNSSNKTNRFNNSNNNKSIASRLSTIGKAMQSLGSNNELSNDIKSQRFINNSKYIYKNWISSFDYTEKDVYWAFTNYTDSYGLLMKRQFALFTRCSCVIPCIPPKVGYLCNRMATLFKSRIVVQRERSEREWREYKRIGIEDAINRAYHEAIEYLQSSVGKEWLINTSYTQTEEIIYSKNIDKAIEKREKILNKRKQKIINSYNKIIKHLNKQKLKKQNQINEELKLLKIEENKMKEGYTKQSLNKRITDLTIYLTRLEEQIEIERLQSELDMKCNEIEKQFYDVELSSSDKDSNSESGSNEDDNKKDSKITKKKDTKIDNQLIEYTIDSNKNVVLNKTTANNNTIKQLPDPQVKNTWALEGGLIDKKKKPTILQIIQRSTVSYINYYIAMYNTTLPDRILLYNQIYKKYLLLNDIINIRMNKLYNKFNGQFDVLQYEIKNELYYQYISYSINEAKRKTTTDFNLIDSIREYWDGSGLQSVFYEWKQWTKDKKHRLHVDIRNEYKSKAQKIETTLVSIDIAQQYINDWEEHIDPFTDQLFWINKTNNKISMSKPGLEHYLPITFQIPDPPKPLPHDVSLESTSSDESDHSSNTKKISISDLKSIAMSGKSFTFGINAVSNDSNDENDYVHNNVDTRSGINSITNTVDNENIRHVNRPDTNSLITSNESTDIIITDYPISPMTNPIITPTSNPVSILNSPMSKKPKVSKKLKFDFDDIDTFDNRNEMINEEGNLIINDESNRLTIYSSTESNKSDPLVYSPSNSSNSKLSNDFTYSNMSNDQIVDSNDIINNNNNNNNNNISFIPANMTISSIAQLSNESSNQWKQIFNYGPDSIRELISTYPKRILNRIKLNNNLEKEKKLSIDSSTELVNNLYSKVETIREFRQNQVSILNKNNNDKINDFMTFIEDEKKTDLNEVSFYVDGRKDREQIKSNKVVDKKRQEINQVRSQTYLHQLYRKPKELIKEDEDIATYLSNYKRLQKQKGLISLVSPNDEKLLALAGADINMARVSGEEGLKLRTIIAERAIHIKNKLKDKAIELNIIKPKKKSFYEREIAPLFRSNYIPSSSSNSDNESDEEKEKKKNLYIKKKNDDKAKKKMLNDRIIAASPLNKI